MASRAAVAGPRLVPEVEHRDRLAASAGRFRLCQHLQTDFPEVAHLLDGVELSAGMVGTWTYATVTEKRDLDDYAKEWIRNNAATVNGWLAR